MQRRHSLEGMKFAQQEVNNSGSQDFEGDPTESDPGYEVKMKIVKYCEVVKRWHLLHLSLFGNYH